MRYGACVLLALVSLSGPASAENAIRIELNTAEASKARCRLSFVIENKDERAVQSLKLDLVVFNTEGAIDRRLIAEMGPLRAEKTIVKTFEVDGDCASLGSILVNDVTACAPAEAGACLERLALSSRLPKVRLFK
jgi:hypothetical protein